MHMHCVVNVHVGHLGIIFDIQIAEMIGKCKEEVWDIFCQFAPQLESLQKKRETTSTKVKELGFSQSDFWEVVGNNLLDLANALGSHDKVTYDYRDK